MSRRVCLLNGRLRAPAAALAALVMATIANGPRPVPAVVIQTPSGTDNTSAPTDDPGWANVGVLGIGSGVYLGDGWVLTAAHVGGGSIVLNGGTYAMLAGSGTTLTNAGEPGKTASTDLYMFQLASTPVGLGSVTIAATSSGSGAAVTMIGAGRDRGAYTEWYVNTNTGTNPWTWTEVPSGGNAFGFKTLDSRTMRWGTNTIAATGAWANDGVGDINMLYTGFNFPQDYSSEAQAAYGDSGGAVFHKNGSNWELTGLMLMVAGYSGQPNPAANAVFGNKTYAADLSFYRPQIMAIVPEPSALALVAAGVAVLVAVRRRHR